MKRNKIITIVFNCLIVLSLVGCGKPNTTDKTENDTSVVSGCEEMVSASIDDTLIFVNVWDDLDENGIVEYIKVTNTEKGVLEFFFNDEIIHKYEEQQERITGFGEKAFVDLDRDGKEEIFVSFDPSVNSMPLVEWFVLKEKNGEWGQMEMHHEGDNLLDNAFPISVLMKDEKYSFTIKCEGYEGEIAYDATRHYTNEELGKEDGDMSFDFFMEQEYQVGDLVGVTSDWGIWNVVAGTYEGDNCLIAEHGLNGLSGKDDYFGQVYVYFDYDENGHIRILNMTFEEARLYNLEEKESENINE